MFYGLCNYNEEKYIFKVENQVKECPMEENNKILYLLLSSLAV